MQKEKENEKGTTRAQRGAVISLLTFAFIHRPLWCAKPKQGRGARDNCPTAEKRQPSPQAAESDRLDRTGADVHSERKTSASTVREKSRRIFPSSSPLRPGHTSQWAPVISLSPTFSLKIPGAATTGSAGCLLDLEAPPFYSIRIVQWKRQICVPRLSGGSLRPPHSSSMLCKGEKKRKRRKLLREHNREPSRHQIPSFVCECEGVRIGFQ